jgi:hypothetical protein
MSEEQLLGARGQLSPRGRGHSLRAGGPLEPCANRLAAVLVWAPAVAVGLSGTACGGATSDGPPLDGGLDHTSGEPTDSSPRDAEAGAEARPEASIDGSDVRDGASASLDSGTDADAGSGFVYFETCTGSACGSSSDELTVFLAGFDRPAFPTTGCTAQTSGACVYYSCPQIIPEPSGASAGSIAISGGSIPAGTIASVDPDDYYTYFATTALFSIGDSLSIIGSGGVVPAFGPVSVVVPPQVAVLSPVIGDGGTLTISTAADLKWTWSGGTPGGSFFVNGNGVTQYFKCRWDVSLGQATVPQAMLAGLAGEVGDIDYGQETTTTFTAGEFAIEERVLPFWSYNVQYQ